MVKTRYVYMHDVLNVLFDCIKAVDESDKALVDYEKAKARIMDLPVLQFGKMENNDDIS